MNNKVTTNNTVWRLKKYSTVNKTGNSECGPVDSGWNNDGQGEKEGYENNK